MVVRLGRVGAADDGAGEGGEGVACDCCVGDVEGCGWGGFLGSEEFLPGVFADGWW